MKYEIPCAVIRDVAPLYAEGLVCGETKELVKGHLEECESCREQYEALTRELAEKEETGNKQAEAEIDYMKRIRRYERSSLFLGAAASFLAGAFLPLVLIGISVFLKGGIEDYQLARLQAAWNILFLKMFLWGLAVCGIYFIVNRFFLFRAACKRR